MVATTFLASALFASVAFAQGAPNASYSQTDIDSLKASVGLTERNSWCTAQHTACGQLCGGQTATGMNKCEGSSLNYTCICSTNNSAPALQFYLNTIPTFECNKLNGNCMSTNANDLAGQEQCNVTYPCGPQVNPTEAAAAASSAAATSSAAQTSSASETAAATSASAAATSAAAAAAVRVGETYGVGILGAGLLAVMGLAL